MTKKFKRISSILMAIFIITTITPAFSKTVKAESTSSEFETMLNEVIEQYGSENIVFEDGIIIKINEELNLNEVLEEENAVWTIKDETILSVNENGTLIGLQEGTTFLVGEVNGKYHLREIYVSEPEQMVQAAFTNERGSSYVVYLDPGHGGEEPGSSGNGILEKELNLKIALDVRKKLENAGVRVIMSRDSDKTVSLKERSQGANAANPDIFISVHTNSFGDSGVYGIECFYNKEIDKRLTENIQNELMKRISTKDRGVKSGDLHVIRETKMPATLVEVGFLSNPAEAERLKNPSIQNALSEAITIGALDYLKNNVSLEDIVGERIYGSDRYETSYKLFEQGWATSDTVVLASGVDYPDALTSAPLARKYNAPILLTKNLSLNSQPKLREILSNKGVKNVIIIGGPTAVYSGLDGELSSMGINVRRLGGKDRYETAVLIAKEVGINKGEISLVNGLSFADGLSISPIAAKDLSPILLTRTNEVPQVTRDFLNGNSISKTFVIGSTSVISDGVAGSVSNPERLGGSDRFKTNKLILDRFKGELDLGTMYVASGFTFPDALASSALAGKNNNFVILSHTTRTDETVKSEIIENRNEIRKAYILGGSVVISDEIIRGLGIRY